MGVQINCRAVGCPFNAFLEDGKKRGLWEVGAEGLERSSDFCVVKSHHSIEEITNYCQSNDKVIYVLRNPKDVLASALNYPWPESRLREFAKKRRRTHCGNTLFEKLWR